MAINVDQSNIDKVLKQMNWNFIRLRRVDRRQVNFISVEWIQRLFQEIFVATSLAGPIVVSSDVQG
jgi:hypothetical protein